MHHPVMGPPEAELGQHVVGIPDEVPIGEEQELDDVPYGLVPTGSALPAGSRSICDWDN